MAAGGARAHGLLAIEPARRHPSQRSGRNSRQESGQDAASVTVEIDTPIWQLATLPSVPEYCRATPGEATTAIVKA